MIGISESSLSHLECPLCGRRHDADVLQNLCTDCGKPLLARYDLSVAARTLTLAALPARPRDCGRHAAGLEAGRGIESLVLDQQAGQTEGFAQSGGGRQRGRALAQGQAMGRVADGQHLGPAPQVAGTRGQ